MPPINGCNMSVLTNIILFDTEKAHDDLLPLSFTRPIADFRVGIRTIRRKWEEYFDAAFSYLPVEYLREKFPCIIAEESIYINGAVLPTPALAKAIKSLGNGQALIWQEDVIAVKSSHNDFVNGHYSVIQFEDDLDILRYPNDIFQLNPSQIKADYVQLTKHRESAPIPDHCIVIGDKSLPDGTPAIFIEEGAEVLATSLNVKEGPIYIGKNSAVMEGATLRGPLAICDNAKVRMGARIYGGSTFGPFCKVGGEIDNAVFFAFSNKAHDGYLGNAVIGEWCNIGAGVNASNLKNDYSKIRLWNYPMHSFRRTDLQFCGLIMADHSKAGINCMFNTATVLGVGVNIHGAGFPRTFIPSFSEGSPVGGMKDVPLKKFYDIAQRAMSRRNIPLLPIDKRIYEKIYEIASRYKHS